MNTEKIQNDIKNSSFFHMNGTILRTLNIVVDSRCSLASLEYVFRQTTDHSSFTESIRYLYESGYIRLTDCNNGNPADLKEDTFRDTEISLTAKGIQVLRGIIADNCIEV